MADAVTIAAPSERPLDDVMQAAHDRMIADFAAAQTAAIRTEYKIEDGKLYEQRFQDVDLHVDFNRHLAENHTKPFYGHDATRHVGSIPFVVCERWCKENGVKFLSKEFREVVRKKLADPDYKFLRVKGY